MVTRESLDLREPKAGSLPVILMGFLAVNCPICYSEAIGNHRREAADDELAVVSTLACSSSSRRRRARNEDVLQVYRLEGGRRASLPVHVLEQGPNRAPWTIIVLGSGVKRRSCRTLGLRVKF